MTTPIPPDFCPYRGLQPYTEQDTEFFFGRERDQNIIISNLYAAPLTVLYGASGVGKSSVLLAGVVPGLRGPRRVAVLVFRNWQGSSFAVGLKQTVLEAVKQTLSADVDASLDLPLDELLTRCSSALRGPVFIVLDQFEEYFLYHPPAHGSQGFEAEFARAVNSHDGRGNFLLSIREDALSKLDRFQQRIPNLLANTLRLDHLSREGAIRAIRCPLAKYNERNLDREPVSIETDLVERLLQEEVTFEQNGQGQVSAQVSAEHRVQQSAPRIETPFLQIVLTRLWTEERPVSKVLRLDTLTRLGGANGIVRGHLNGALVSLSADEREVAARVFHHLVTPSGTKIAYTAADLAMYANLEVNRVTPVLQALSAQEKRILRPVAAPFRQRDEARYEIFHDALAPAVLHWRRRYVEHQAKEQARLEEQVRQEELRRAAEEQSERERATKRTQRLRSAVAVLLLLMAFLSGAALWAFEQRRNAVASAKEAAAAEAKAKSNEQRAQFARAVAESLQMVAAGERAIARMERETAVAQHRVATEQRAMAVEQRRIAISRELAASAIAQLSTDPELSLLLATEAMHVTHGAARDTHTVEATYALRRALAGSRIRAVMRGHTDRVRNAAFSPDGRLVVTTSDDGMARIWDARTGMAVSTLAGLTRWFVPSAAFSSDGTLVVTTEGGLAYVWEAATESLLAQIEGTSSFLSAAFSPDGKLVATGSIDHKAQLWETATGTPVATLQGHTGSVVLLAFSPDGSRLATEADDGTGMIWDVPKGTRLFTLRGLLGEKPAIAFSPDGMWLATQTKDETTDQSGALVWEVATGKLVAELKGHTKTVNTVAFSPDSRLLATASDDSTARVSDVSSGDLVALLRGRSEMTQAAFSPNGQDLVTGSADGAARVWRVATNSLIAELRGHTDALVAAAFSPDGRWIVTGGDSTAQLWAAPGGIKLDHVVTPSPAAGLRDLSRLLTSSLRGLDRLSRTSAAFSPDGALVVTTGGNSEARLWEAATGRLTRTFPGHAHVVAVAEFSADGTRLVTASEDGTARIWEVRTGALIATLRGHTEEVVSAEFSPDGEWIVTAGADHKARLWEARTGMPIVELRGHTSMVGGAVFSPDGRWVLTSGSLTRARQTDTTAKGHERATSRYGWFVRGDSSVQVWKAGTTERVADLRAYKPPRRAAFSPNGAQVVTAGVNLARVWEVNTGKLILQLVGHTDEVVSAEFSPDGSLIATASSDGTARVWEARSGRPVVELRGHTDVVRSVAFSLSGRWLVTAGDTSARVWEVHSGELVAAFGGVGEVRRADFSPDGKSVLMLGDGGSAQIESCEECRPPEELLALARSRTLRGLTPAEKEKYLHQAATPGIHPVPK